ncbi:MAG: peptidylprolyl isomerase [Deltaproteobacteria bacterium]|nr:peptidylprolyl isomerase [Deltaproteobacteria bacterium]
MNLALRLSILVGLLAISACAHDATTPDGSAACPYASANDGTQSYEILCTDPIATHVRVKHILIGWKDLPTGRPLDARAQGRTYAEAQQLARDLLQQVRSGAAIEPLMAKYSEDPGSAQSGVAYEASPDASLVSEFKALSLRLKVGDSGIVKSQFGLHVIKRVP